jgi:hypothetical protein
MNWRRGFLRIWIILSVLFAVGVVTLSMDDIKAAYHRYMFYVEDAKWAPIVPVECSDVRGKDGVDFHRVALGSDTVHCWYDIQKFRGQFPEYKDMTDDTLSDRLYAKLGMPTQHLPSFWEMLAVTAGKAIGIPLTVLALGCAMTWAVAGFRSSTAG